MTKHSRRAAVIDIGSNTVQLLIAESEEKRFRQLLFQLRTTRLGAGIVPGQLPADGIAATLAVLREFQLLIKEYAVSKVRVTATSAVRDAANSGELINAALAETGFAIEVLSGAEEARLSFFGATANLAGVDAHTQDLLMIDIGGSSSELARWQNGCLSAVSANVGAVRAKTQGWDGEEIHAKLAKIIIAQPGDKAMQAIGVGGTITTAAGLLLECRAYDRAAIEGYTLTALEIEQLLSILQPLSIGERCAFSPLLAQRGEIMYEGLLILASFFKLLDLPDILVSGGGLPDGSLIFMT